MEEFIHSCIVAITSHNDCFIICGYNELGLTLYSRVKALGLSDQVLGFIDPFKKPFGSEIKFYDITELNTLSFQTIIVTLDEQKEEALLVLKDNLSTAPRLILFGNKNYDFYDRDFTSIISSLHIKSKAGGYPNMLIHIYQSLKYIIQNKIKGDIVELGTYRGGTTVFIAKVLELCGENRKIFSFDTFQGFPKKKNLLDIFDEEEYTFSDFETVERYCSSYNIDLIKGDISQTINVLRDKKISFSFIDTDNYSATRLALETIYGLTAVGGVIAFDHYFSKDWINTVGERIAAKEVFIDKNVFNLHGTGIFMKIQ